MCNFYGEKIEIILFHLQSSNLLENAKMSKNKNFQAFLSIFWDLENF